MDATPIIARGRLRVRDFRPGDEPALSEVFASAVHEVASADYSPEQVNAWAPLEYDALAWARRMQGIQPFVAEREGRIVGYADVQHDGYIDHFFVAGSAGKSGVGAALMRRIHQRAALRGIVELTSNVSITARPFFERFGFEVVAAQKVTSGDVEFDNFRMRATPRPLAALTGRVDAVCCDADHGFSKPVRPSITLLAGRGVAGDAHCGADVQHRSRVARDPGQPNLRQVHLLHAELFDELAAAGHAISAGDIGENITTSDLPLPDLPAGTLLHIGNEAVVELTGLRNPCLQLDQFRDGLMRAVLARDPQDQLVRKAGVMSIARSGGVVRAGDVIRVALPAPPFHRLEPV